MPNNTKQRRKLKVTTPHTLPILKKKKKNIDFDGVLLGLKFKGLKIE
jgi:hypothetical protein